MVKFLSRKAVLALTGLLLMTLTTAVTGAPTPTSPGAASTNKVSSSANPTGSSDEVWAATLQLLRDQSEWSDMDLMLPTKDSYNQAEWLAILMKLFDGSEVTSSDQFNTNNELARQLWDILTNDPSFNGQPTTAEGDKTLKTKLQAVFLENKVEVNPEVDLSLFQLITSSAQPPTPDQV
ncbi:hypothetical protein H4R33_003951 [Dimargaris cristalligena]|nr:hypothetical protein H4R33_003951 [Dimargaris cristalligena]